MLQINDIKIVEKKNMDALLHLFVHKILRATTHDNIYGDKKLTTINLAAAT